MIQKISLAYSPDTDDAFMVYAMQSGKIDLRGYEFTYVSKDIQELNEQATREIYDITAISVAAYPDIADKYWLMPVGASIGDRFGPALVGLPESEIQSLADLSGKRVAIPGLKTSAYFALSALAPPFTPVPMTFHKIEKAVLNQEVDAGLLIHELQLNYPEVGLKKIADLGEVWSQRFDLPLPLGVNAIHRRLGVAAVPKLTKIYLDSIRWALAHKSLVTKAASLAAFAGLSDTSLAELYISRYVNERSLNLASDVVRGIDLMYSLSSAKGLCRNVSPSADYICAVESQNL